MSYTKTILCLANSRKHSGRCIAGKEVNNDGYGSWIRPVRARPSEEISEEERGYENGQDPKVLDIIRIPMTVPRPRSYQSENHLIDDRYYWTLIERATWNQALAAVDTVNGPLWVNDESTYYGLNDRVSQHVSITLTRSLLLIRPEALRIQVGTEGADFGNPKRRVRARFTLNGEQYNLVVTDPIIERQYLAGRNGVYPIDTSLLCISLADYEGRAYKLVATVLTPDLAG